MTIPSSYHKESARMVLQKQLDHHLQKLREDHQQFRKVIEEWELVAKRADQAYTIMEAASILCGLKLEMRAFRKCLNDHAKWEDSCLLPLFNEFLTRMQNPTMIASLWVIEKEQALADEYWQAFEDAIHSFTFQAHAIDVAEAIQNLRLACELEKNHLAMEEQIMFPLADELLDDLEILYY
jgi:iron-sulfur cluster repair protein YtfE (RIC family)